MHLGDRVLRSASRPEPIRARLKVDLEDRLQHQLERGLHNPVADRRDPQATQLAAACCARCGRTSWAWGHWGPEANGLGPEANYWQAFSFIGARAASIPVAAEDVTGNRTLGTLATAMAAARRSPAS